MIKDANRLTYFMACGNERYRGTDTPMATMASVTGATAIAVIIEICYSQNFNLTHLDQYDLLCGHGSLQRRSKTQFDIQHHFFWSKCARYGDSKEAYTACSASMKAWSTLTLFGKDPKNERTGKSNYSIGFRFPSLATLVMGPVCFAYLLWLLLASSNPQRCQQQSQF